MTSHWICQSKHGHVVDQHPVHALDGRPGHQRQDGEAAEGIVPGMAEEHVEEGGEDDRVETLENLHNGIKGCWPNVCHT